MWAKLMEGLPSLMLAMLLMLAEHLTVCAYTAFDICCDDSVKYTMIFSGMQLIP